jgi:hypothetical protein
MTEIIEATNLDEDSIHEVSGIVESPSQQRKVFTSLKESLEFAMWARPRSLAINTESGHVVMDYLGSEGHS